MLARESPRRQGWGFLFFLGMVWLAGCSAVPSPGSSSSPRVVPQGLVRETEDEPLADTRATGKIDLRLTANGVKVTPPWPEGELWRGYSPLTFSPRESRVALSCGPPFLDHPVADGVTLYYLARSPDGEIRAEHLSTPAVDLPKMERPRIVVDKLRYTLSLLDGDSVVKRYRIGLGGEPVARKICQDNLSTPEGLYTIYNLQPEATFTSAFDIDYPNAVDTLRHKLGREAGLVPSDRDTGGEIQIHGMGSFGNWTAGCIALDDEDIGELFTHPEIAVGTEVFITGSEIKPEDRPWLKAPPVKTVKTLQSALAAAGFFTGSSDGNLGPATQEALGRYQLRHQLPLTCQLDSATRAHFGL